jgi:hypothetical protein
MIKIFKIGNLSYTPFDRNFIEQDFLYLKNRGIEITDSKKNANIFVASDFNNLRRFIFRNPFLSKYLLWTNEPRFSKVTTESFRIPLLYRKIHVMNVYNGTVFTNNVTYQKSRFLKQKKMHPLNSSFILKNRKLVALMSYYHGGLHSKLVIEGNNIDLIKKRTDLALYGHNRNLIDIFGKGWPQNIAKEDSRTGQWGARKREVLQQYNFNLAFENTVAPFYVTEKIWDSIENYCLPIYYGGLTSTIYEIFPKNSFIDFSQFEDAKSLYDFIQSITNEEYKTRMNKCIAVYNEFAGKPLSFWENTKKKMLDNIAEICHKITFEK